MANANALEKAALERKARLKALKGRAKGSDDGVRLGMDQSVAFALPKNEFSVVISETKAEVQELQSTQ